MPSVFSKAIPASTLAAAKQVDLLSSNSFLTASPEVYTRALSMLDFWDIEKDVFKVKMSPNEHSKLASGRIEGGTNYTYRVCHGNLGKSLYVDQTVTIPFMYMRFNSNYSDDNTWNPNDWKILWYGEEASPSTFPCTSGVALSDDRMPFETMRSFYFWLTSKRNPVWAKLLPEISDVVIHKTGNIPFGTTFKVKKFTSVVRQFLCMTRLFVDMHLTDISKYRRKIITEWRTKLNLPWAVVVLRAECLRNSGHNFLSISPYTMFNWLTNTRTEDTTYGYFSTSYDKPVPAAKQVAISVYTPEETMDKIQTWRNEGCKLIV